MNDETLLTTELNRRAAGLAAPHLSFEDVRGRAHGIRRRRRAGAAAAVAAVVALAVIVPTVLSGGSGGSDGIDPAPKPLISPGASVLHDRTVTLPDGNTVPIDVDNAQVGLFGVLADGRVVVARSDSLFIDVYARGGTREAQFAVDTTALVMSQDESAAAWVDQNHLVQLLESGAAEPVTLGQVPSDEVTIFMVEAVTNDGRVLLGDGTTTMLEATTDGVRPLTTSEPLSVTDVSPDGSLWAVRVDGPDPQFGCSGLYDPESDEMVARNCDTSGLRFSPDGQHLLGMRGDNNMYGEASTFDLDLQAVGSFEPEGEGHVVSRAAWADPTHLLVTMADWKTSEWSLVRVGLDWSGQEVVDGPVDGGNPEMVVEFLPSS